LRMLRLALALVELAFGENPISGPHYNRPCQSVFERQPERGKEEFAVSCAVPPRARLLIEFVYI